MLDQAQEQLAKIANIEKIGDSYSLAWRRHLDTVNSNTPENRQKMAYDLLKASASSDQALHKLIHDDSAMMVLTERSSNIRKLGNVSAHRLAPVESLLHAASSLPQGNEQSGMLEVIDYLKAKGHAK